MYIHIFAVYMLPITQAIKQDKFNSEHEKALVNLMYTTNQIGTHQIRFFKEFGLSPQQYNVLRILRGSYPQPVTVTVVQERMLDKMSNASRLIDKLLVCKLVVRNACDQDRRQVNVSINKKGLKLLSKIDPQLTVMNAKLCGLSEREAIQLNTLLDKLRIHIQP
jgi:DNA-binding MarR family transcriptional regulator